MSSKASKQLEEKNQKILRKLLTLPENKKCFDCKEKGPFYACTTYGTFVCPTCSGIHREFGHRVKSVSMATFTTQEVQFLQDTGNANAAAVWLAKWRPEDYEEPDSSDKTRIREFMKLKYVDRRWYRKPKADGAPSSAKSPPRASRRDDTPKIQPIEAILGKDVPPIQVVPTSQGTNGAKARASNSGGGEIWAPAPKDNSLIGGWDAPAPTPATRPPITTPLPTSPTPFTPSPAPSSNSLEGIFSLPSVPTSGAPGAVTGGPAVGVLPPSTIWPPPAAAGGGGLGPIGPTAGHGVMVSPTMTATPPGYPGGGYPAAAPPAAALSATPPFQQLSAQAFQQLTPQQQQAYLAAQQQWIQQQQALLQQRMAQLSVTSPPGSGGAIIAPGSSGPYAPASSGGPGSSSSSNPFLTGIPAAMGAGYTAGPGPLAPLSAGSMPPAGGAVGGYASQPAGGAYTLQPVGGGYPPMGSGGFQPMPLTPSGLGVGAVKPAPAPEKKTDPSANLLFAELSPIAAVKGTAPPPAVAAPVRGPPMGSLGGQATASNPFGNSSNFNPFAGKSGDLL